MGWEYVANIKGEKGDQGDQGEPGLQGLPGDTSNYTVFTQSVPALVWTINHGLSYAPDINVYDSSGDLMFADVTNFSGYLEISFAFPTTGSTIYR
jgi:hypothetical protein